MKAKKVLAVLVLVLFAVSSVAFADCNTCSKPKPVCNTCGQQTSMCGCPKPCNACSRAKASCNTCSQPRPCDTCDKVALGYKRDALGNRVPTQTYEGGTNHDTATKSENTLLSGQE